MGRLPHSRVSLLVHLLGLAALGAGLAQWFGAPSSAPATHAVRTTSTAEGALAALPAAHAPADPPPPSTAAAAVAVAFELEDVVRAPHGRLRAMLRINGGPPTPFAWGDLVSVGVRLSRVLPTGVELQRGGVVEYLPLAASARPRSMPVLQSVSANGFDTMAPTEEGADEPSIIARPADQAPPSSNAIDRAIRRATAS